MSTPKPVALEEHALDQLRYIRSTMERASAFTAIPGTGIAAMGLIGAAASFFAARQTDIHVWVRWWWAAAALAICAGGTGLFAKARRLGFSLRSEAGRKFAIGFLPPLAAAACLTFPLAQAGMRLTLAATWLMAYGCGVAAGGTHSARVVPAMGFAFLGLGVATLFLPAAWADAALGLGFGGFHILFGIVIARRYGG